MCLHFEKQGRRCSHNHIYLFGSLSEPNGFSSAFAMQKRWGTGVAYATVLYPIPGAQASCAPPRTCSFAAHVRRPKSAASKYNPNVCPFTARDQLYRRWPNFTFRLHGFSKTKRGFNITGCISSWPELGYHIALCDLVMKKLVTSSEPFYICHQNY